MDFLAIAGLAILGTAIGIYILGQQNLRFPLVQETPKQIKIELANAQAVQPGQGQTVRVAGVEVGRIADVELEDGIAVVTLDIEQRLREPDPERRDRPAAAEDRAEGHVHRGGPGARQGRARGRADQRGQLAAGHRPRRGVRRARRRHASRT